MTRNECLKSWTASYPYSNPRKTIEYKDIRKHYNLPAYLGDIVFPGGGLFALGHCYNKGQEVMNSV